MSDKRKLSPQEQEIVRKMLEEHRRTTFSEIKDAKTTMETKDKEPADKKRRD